MHFHKKTLINRQTLLKGLGASMSLPWLEVMAEQPKTAAQPIRMAYVFMPNGVNEEHWTPEGEGENFKFSKTLSPLESFKNDLLVLTNLMNKNSIGGDGHYAKVANLLSGAEIVKTTGKGMRSGLSVDQYAAQQKGSATLLPSLELSIQDPSTFVDNNVGYTALYGGYVSWSSPTSPVARETYPRLAFDRLFNRKSNAAESISLLDQVSVDIKKLIQKVGHADQHKLEEYLTSVRDLETRISFADSSTKPIDHAWLQKHQPNEGIPSKTEEHQKLMYRIMALAFQMDRTRIGTYMLGRAVSGLSYTFLGQGITSNHHSISHHSGDEDKKRQYQIINQYHITLFANFLEQLKNMKEGDHSVLDHSMIFFGSGLRDGNAHSPYNLPILLAGGNQAGLKTGRHLIYPKNTPLCKLYVSMLKRFGVDTHQFGDAEDELPNLS